MRYRECTALLISSLWRDCKNIFLPTGIRRPPSSCWKSTPHESELSETDDGNYYMAWSLWRGTWIYSPWASVLVAGSWHCNSWCCARKPKQPNQCNQCKDQILSYKLFSNTIIFFGPHTTRCTQLHTALDWITGLGGREILTCESNGCWGPNEWNAGIWWSCDRVMWPCSLDQTASQSPSRSQIPPN